MQHVAGCYDIESLLVDVYVCSVCECVNACVYVCVACGAGTCVCSCNETKLNYNITSTAHLWSPVELNTNLQITTGASEPCVTHTNTHTHTGPHTHVHTHTCRYSFPSLPLYPFHSSSRPSSFSLSLSPPPLPQTNVLLEYLETSYAHSSLLQPSIALTFFSSLSPQNALAYQYSIFLSSILPLSLLISLLSQLLTPGCWKWRIWKL